MPVLGIQQVVRQGTRHQTLGCSRIQLIVQATDPIDRFKPVGVLHLLSLHIDHNDTKGGGHIGITILEIEPMNRLVLVVRTVFQIGQMIDAIGRQQIHVAFRITARIGNQERFGRFVVTDVADVGIAQPIFRRIELDLLVRLVVAIQRTVGHRKHLMARLCHLGRTIIGEIGFPSGLCGRQQRAHPTHAKQQVPSHTRFDRKSANFRTARARWLMPFFTSSPSSAKLAAYPSGMKMGS